jgi:hypothetical protein
MPTLRLRPFRDGPSAAFRCLKAVACKANRVYHPLVFLVEDRIDGFIAKRIFLANPRTLLIVSPGVRHGNVPCPPVLGRPLGGPVLLSLKNSILRSPVTKTPLRLALFLVLCVTLAAAQKPSPDAGGLPKYDLHSEMKTKGVVDEVKLLPLGAKRDITELIIKNGDDKVYIYVCPKAFQEEMGINFAKGDEIAVTGSKVKLEALDVILARQLVKGTDTLQFRDDKGNPVWDWRTGK